MYNSIDLKLKCLDLQQRKYEPLHDKTNKKACAPSEDSDQPGHLGLADWMDAQADLSLRWAHIHFVGFVMRWRKCQNVWRKMTSTLTT